MYVCEDCGFTTSDPEVHFKHLQQNHPFCPALARCHDKRQFKFKSETETTEAKEPKNVPFDEAAFAAAMISGGNDAQDIAETVKTELPEHPVMAADVRTDNANNTETPTSEANDDMAQHSNVAAFTHSSKPGSGSPTTHPLIYHTDRLTNKRHINESPTASPQKKPRNVNSPKKLKSQSSPMKVRPLSLSLSENGSVPIPKLDLENMTSKKFSEQPVKKRPLGSLTQNTIHQLNAKNNQTIQNNGTMVYEPKKPLGNIIENNQW